MTGPRLPMTTTAELRAVPRAADRPVTDEDPR